MEHRYYKFNASDPGYPQYRSLCEAQHKKALPNNLLSENFHKDRGVVWVKVSGTPADLDALEKKLTTIDKADRRTHKTKVFNEVHDLSWMENKNQ